MATIAELLKSKGISEGTFHSVCAAEGVDPQTVEDVQADGAGNITAIVVAEPAPAPAPRVQVQRRSAPAPRRARTTPAPLDPLTAAPVQQQRRTPVQRSARVEHALPNVLRFYAEAYTRRAIKCFSEDDTRCILIVHRTVADRLGIRPGTKFSVDLGTPQ